MRLTTALSLLLGLGGRIAFNKFVKLREPPTIEDHVLNGLCQGVALYYFLMEFPYLAFGVAFGIAARLVINLVLNQNATECACTLLGVALGVLFTDLLSQFVEDEGSAEARRARYEGSIVEELPRRRRIVQFRRASSVERERHHARRRREFIDSTPSSSTTSTNSWEALDWVDPTHSMTFLEREVAALRKKASLADSERRRFKEERKWAQSQGNQARASQMGWQVKRYSALMQSFHREADLRLLEATNTRHQQELASAVSQIGIGSPPVMQPAGIPPTFIAPTTGAAPLVYSPPAVSIPSPEPMRPGSNHTTNHTIPHIPQHRKTRSILSRPSVRIDVQTQEIPRFRRRSRSAQRYRQDIPNNHDSLYDTGY